MYIVWVSVVNRIYKRRYTYMDKLQKKPKMSKERYEFLENIRTNDPKHNGAIIEKYPDEWADFNIAYKYYNYRIGFSKSCYTGQ